MIKTNLNNSTCFEVKTYRYVLNNERVASFELLIFKSDEIGTQGEIYGTGECFSPSKLYKNIDEAIQETIDIIERKIKMLII